MIFHCDNLGTVQAWQSLNSSSEGVLEIMRRMVDVAAENNFTFTLKHIDGLRSDIADSLSRFQIERFFHLAPEAQNSPILVPEMETIFTSLYPV